MRAPVFALTSIIIIGCAASSFAEDDGLALPPSLNGPTPPPLVAPASNTTAIGRWRVRGRHRRLGPFSGRLEVYPATDGLHYERAIRYQIDATKPVVDAGTALTSRGRFVTRQVLAAKTTGLASVIVHDYGATLRKAEYVQTGDARWTGTFTVEGAGPDDQGFEELDRQDGEDAFRLMVDGKEAFPVIREALRSAERSISIEMYIWKGDDTGKSIGALLAEKARAGVEVRCLVDAIGVSDGGDKVLDQIKAAGGQVIVHNQWYKGVGNSIADLGRGLWNGIKSLFGGHSAPREKNGIFNHDHRKVIVVDGRVGFVGGMNFAHEYEFEWHDMQSRDEGPIAAKLQDAFLDRWRAAGGQAPADRARLYFDWSRTTPAGDSKLAVISSIPGLSEEIRTTYLDRIARARTRVLIENSYFLDDDVIHALERKAGERVPVTVIIPTDEKNDVAVVKDAFQWVENDVINSGIELRKYNGRMVHTKAATIDSRWSTVGSANLDPMGLHKLAELNVATDDPRIATIFEQRIFFPDLLASERAQPRKLSFWQKIKSGVLHFFSGIL